MNTFIVKADEPLFDRWREIGFKITRQNAIVQNDMEVPLPEMMEWLKRTDDLVKDLAQLVNDTYEHVTKEAKDA